MCRWGLLHREYKPRRIYEPAVGKMTEGVVRGQRDLAVTAHWSAQISKI